MLYQIAALLLDIGSSLLGGACLLRFYMQWHRISFANPLGRMIFALTNWLVLPLRRVVPAVAGGDSSSVLGAWLLEMAQYGVLWLLSPAAAPVSAIPVLAVFGLLRLVLSALTGLMIVYAILSWVQTQSPMADLVERLCAPLLRRIRRWVPLVGGMDFSPLALLVLLQILAIVLSHLQASVLHAL